MRVRPSAYGVGEWLLKGELSGVQQGMLKTVELRSILDWLVAPYFAGGLRSAQIKHRWGR